MGVSEHDDVASLLGEAPASDRAWPGYQPDFLGAAIAPPVAQGAAPVLEYVHFTVAMNTQRRLAWWSAWNIDGARLLPSDGLDRDDLRFRPDPRLPTKEQTTAAVYSRNRLDRGHLARRADLLWGTLAEAQAANADSFFFPNITPQVDDFNQSSKGGVWGLLENAVLSQEGLTDRRVTAFAGPVLAANDPPYRGLVQIPRDHWKVVVYRIDGEPRFRCFVLTQDLDGGVLRGGFLQEFITYAIPLPELQRRTSLTFPGLDGLRDASTAEPGQGGELTVAPAIEIAAVDDVRW